MPYTLALLLLIPLQAWANAFLPLYYSGFEFTTLVVILPLIIGGEALIFGWLRRRNNETGGISALRISLRANIYSALLGMFLVILPFAALEWIWTSSSELRPGARLIMRQLLVASFMVTVPIEAFVMNSSWGGKRFFWPDKKYWKWSLIANAASYGFIAWMFVIGWLKEEDTTPMFWHFLSRLAPGSSQ